MNSQTKTTQAAPTKKAAPMDPEMRRYMLELEIKKKEEEKKKKAAEERKRKEEEKKQKLAEEKRKKEELAAQAKEPKSGPGSRGSLSQASKGAENKSSLSNLDENEANKREGKTQESLKPQSGGSFSAGSEGYLREDPVRKGEEETMEVRASRIKADLLQANHRDNRDVRASNSNLDSRREENYDEDFEIKTPQRDAWELKKSIAEKQQKIEEVRRSVYEQQQGKGIREDLPSYKIEETNENLGGSRSNFKAQNLVSGSFHDNKSQQNVVDVAMNSKGFQRKPLQKVVEPEDLRNLQQTVGAVAMAVDNNLGKIKQNNNVVREPIAEKTKQQMEIAMQAKRFMMEQQKAKKKNEEAAIEKKKQILNQLYNKNATPRISSASTYHEERATPVANRHEEYMPEPVNHEEQEEEEVENQQQQQFKFEDSIRNSRLQGQKFGVEEHDQQNRFEDSIRNSRVQGVGEPAENRFEGSIRNSRAHMEPVEYNNQQQHRFEDPIRNSRVQEQSKPPVEEQWESPRDEEEPEEEDDDNKGQWEDGNDENDEEPEENQEDPYENEEDQYQQDDQGEEEEDEEQEQPFSDRDNGRGYNNGNQRQYYDDPSGLAELDRPDDWNRYPQKSKEEIRQSVAQRSNQKSEWGYSRGDYEYEENEDDQPKTPYKEEFRQTPQSSAHKNQNEWSYDDVRQSTQSKNNYKAQNQYQQPEDNHEKSDEEPQLSYAQLHARNKKKAEEQAIPQSFGRNNQPPVHYDPFENYQVDPNMATFGRKYVNNNNGYSDEDDEKDYRPQNQKSTQQAAYKKEETEEQNQWGSKEEPKRPQASGPRYEQSQKNTYQAAYQKEESDDRYEQDEPQNQWGQKQPVYSNPMGQSIDKRSQAASVRASHQSHQSENENFVKIRDAFNDNKKQNISAEPEKPAARGTRKWDLKRDFEAEDMTPTEKLSKGDEDLNTASFGDKLPRIRKQWGAQEKPESLTTSVKDLDQQQQKRKTEENDEEEMLRSYRQNQVQKEKKEEVKEEVVTPPAKPEKQVLMVFGDDGEDEVLKQRKQEQFEKMKRRMEQRQKDKEEKKERDRSFVRENAKERATPDIVANYSDNEDAVPSSKRPQNKFTRQSTAEKPPEKLPRIPSAKPNIPRNQSTNVATRPPVDKERERPETLEELHSVGPSAKSNKSMAKSPGGPNNIFQKERTPSAIGGKKGVIEFSKQSNRPLIKNAITNVCLAGEPNRKEREEVVAKLNEVAGDVNFIIVFKPITGRQDFRALYAYDTNTEEIRKVFSKGNAPDVLDANLVENYYRYNSGAKEFKHIQGNKSFSRAVDAVSLHAYLFKKATADKLY